jgi:hypothetical protein
MSLCTNKALDVIKATDAVKVHFVSGAWGPTTRTGTTTTAASSFCPHGISVLPMAGTNQYPMPPPTADRATQWAYLEEGVDHIMTKLLTLTDLSYAKYMSLYTVAYNYVFSPISASGPSRAGQYLSLLMFRLPRADMPLQLGLISWGPICTTTSRNTFYGIYYI